MRPVIIFDFMRLIWIPLTSGWGPLRSCVSLFVLGFWVDSIGLKDVCFLAPSQRVPGSICSSVGEDAYTSPASSPSAYHLVDSKISCSRPVCCLGLGGGCFILRMCSSLALFLVVSFLILGSTSSAPRMFTLMAERVKAGLGRLGIRTSFCLDVLDLGSSFQFCLSVLQEALPLLMKGGSSSTGRSLALS